MKYTLTIETLSPLHIGSGVELIAGFDYVSPDDQSITYVLDQDAIYAAELHKNGAQARLGQKASVLLGPGDLRPDSPYVRYTLNGNTRLERLQEQLMDVSGRVYLPGSTIKGALRNALMTYAATLMSFNAQDLNSDARYAAQQWEKQVFGDLPQNDLLRALQAADSAALPLTPSPLESLPVQVFSQASDEQSAPIWVEAVSKNQVFVSSLIIDELTLQYANDSRLRWGNKVGWLLNLLPILQAVSLRRIEQEFTKIQARGFSESADFYADLKSQAEKLPGTNSAFLQIGWGTGWMGMTIASALDKPTRDHLRVKYKLGKPPTWNDKEMGVWEPILSKPYPKSRRLKAIRSGKASLADLPLGWVRLTIDPVGAPTLPDQWAKLTARAGQTFQALAEFAAVSNLPEYSASLDLEFPGEDAIHEPFIPPPPVPKRIVASFTDTPEIGDGFDGSAFLDEKGEVQLIIPGLPDDQAYAVLKRSENTFLGKYQDGKIIPCVVIGIEPDPDQPKTSRVLCRMPE